MNNHDDDKLGDWMKLGIYFVLMGLFVLLMAGCVSTPPPKGALSPLGSWAYDQVVAAHLTPEMLVAHPGDLCPNKDKADAEFWKALVHATVDAESGGNPLDDYTEKFTADNGTAQVSSGLLQLSLDDAKRGGNCAGLSPATIHQAAPNLACGMEIMALKLGTRSTMRASLGLYWSTIRDGKTDAEMKQLLPACFSAQNDKLEMMDAGEAK